MGGFFVPELWSVLISAITIGFTALGFIVQHFTTQTKTEGRLSRLEEQAKEFEKNLQEQNELSEKVELACSKINGLEIKMDIFWKSLETTVIGALHHPCPEYKDRDELLDKLKDGVITDKERNLLDEMLTCEIQNPRTVEEQTAAKILLSLNHTFRTMKNIMAKVC